MAAALGLDLITPPGFLKAISEGVDPAATDKTTIDRQIREHRLEVYVFNRQNSTPDVTAQVSAARAAGIPVVAMTETLTPAGASFQGWQVAQLEALRTALHEATAR
jgi:zinc/manganese transport system substrate-binding protein